MTFSVDGYADWKAPAEDGQTLLWPDPAELLAYTFDNGKLLRNANDIRIQNVPLPELRSAMRRTLCDIDDNQPLIASGHQTELYHPGVWVKDVLAHYAAKKIGGKAMHLAVDTDQPKHLQLRWPGGGESLTGGMNSAAWSGALDCPSTEQLAHLRSQAGLAAEAWNFKSELAEFFPRFERACRQSKNLSAALTAAEHALDESLGLDYQSSLVSPILNSPPYLAFVHHLLANAPRFAADYNAALAEYRLAAGIQSNSRPMPDLHHDTNVVEVAFWLGDLEKKTRRRAEVHRHSQGWMLDDFLFDPRADGWSAAQKFSQWLTERGLRLAPRALTLTTFLRLLLVDQFIHGIGGRYDQVTDRLMLGFFKIMPPHFAVTTATLYFPEAAGRSRICLSCLVQEGHHLRHNLLGSEKQNLLAQLQAAPRQSMERSIIFHNMHSALAAAAIENPKLRDWQQRLESAEQRDRLDNQIFDRELFYAIQPRERLNQLMEQYSAAFGYTAS